MRHACPGFCTTVMVSSTVSLCTNSIWSESSDDDDDDADGCWAPGVVVAQHYREANMDVGYYAPYQVRLDSGGLIYVEDPAEQIRAAQSEP